MVTPRSGMLLYLFFYSAAFCSEVTHLPWFLKPKVL